MIELLNNIWAVLLDTAFWLLIGLLAAGVIKTYIPESAMRRWVGGKGFGSVSRAALFGAPLPLCSCGVLPAAIGLHRAGASKEATVSFLISTPETSVDSVAVTYALMGPVMAIYRPIAALMNAMVTGMMTSFVSDEKLEQKVVVEDEDSHVTVIDTVAEDSFKPDDTLIDADIARSSRSPEESAEQSAKSSFKPDDTLIDADIARSSRSPEESAADSFKPDDTLIDADIARSSKSAEQSAEMSAKINSGASSCCAAEPESDKKEHSCCSGEKDANHAVETSRWLKSLHYAGAELLDDIAKWMAFGIVLAGIMLTYVPTDWLAQWGGGLSAMLVMLVVGIPLYICAVASTPVAAGLLLAGVSPGAVLVFLLVGPATNVASFALVKRELGLKVTIVYLLGLSIVSVAMGLLLELLLSTQGWQIEAKLGEASAMLPMWLSWGSAILLIFFAIKPLRKAVLPSFG